MSAKKLLGHIGVDAGLCWIGDPCYVMGDEASSRVHSWSEFCGKLHDGGSHSTPLGANTGIAVSTGYGDGCYPVEAVMDDNGTRVKSVTITFIGDEDSSYDY